MSSLKGLGTLVENQASTGVRIYFWVLSSISLIRVALCCLNYRGSVVSLEVEQPSYFTPLFQGCLTIPACRFVQSGQLGL